MLSRLDRHRRADKEYAYKTDAKNRLSKRHPLRPLSSNMKLETDEKLRQFVLSPYVQRVRPFMQNETKPQHLFSFAVQKKRPRFVDKGLEQQ